MGGAFYYSCLAKSPLAQSLAAQAHTGPAPAFGPQWSLVSGHGRCARSLGSPGLSLHQCSHPQVNQVITLLWALSVSVSPSPEITCSFQRVCASLTKAPPGHRWLQGLSAGQARSIRMLEQPTQRYVLHCPLESNQQSFMCPFRLSSLVCFLLLTMLPGKNTSV